MARRVAWVTGGGRGIGAACALRLARQGCDIAVSARTVAEVREVARACEKHEARSVALVCDVTDAAAVRQTHASIAEALGTPAILVTAAGLARSSAFLKTTPEFLEDLWRVNLLGTFHCIQAALPAMLEGGWGRVVAIASVAGKAGAAYTSAYASSKHAVLGLTRSLAAEVADKGVTVNAVCPGYVDTRMTQENVDIIVRKTGLARADALEHVLATSPQHRMLDPDEVAALVGHLATDEARGIHGQAITIDGGGIQW